MGRPMLGAEAAEFVALRLPPELVKEVDAWMARTKVSRSAAVRDLIERGLASPRKRGRASDRG